ncbi:hypothetical protein [Chloroflexus sp.]|nr:hypothetical protein [Chloroflexus sp.]
MSRCDKGLLPAQRASRLRSHGALGVRSAGPHGAAGAMLELLALIMWE